MLNAELKMSMPEQGPLSPEERGGVVQSQLNVEGAKEVEDRHGSFWVLENRPCPRGVVMRGSHLKVSRFAWACVKMFRHGDGRKRRSAAPLSQRKLAWSGC